LPRLSSRPTLWLLPHIFSSGRRASTPRVGSPCGRWTTSSAAVCSDSWGAASVEAASTTRTTARTRTALSARWSANDRGTKGVLEQEQWRARMLQQRHVNCYLK
jgi:hypothetical protein